MDVFVTLLVVVSHMLTYKTVHFRHVQFTFCPSHLHKSVPNKCPKVVQRTHPSLAPDAPHFLLRSRYYDSHFIEERESKRWMWLPQGHTAGKWKNWNSHQCLSYCKSGSPAAPLAKYLLFVGSLWTRGTQPLLSQDLSHLPAPQLLLQTQSPPWTDSQSSPMDRYSAAYLLYLQMWEQIHL